MENHFEKEKAIASFSHGSVEKVLETVAMRYIGANPRFEYTARPFFTGGITRNKDYRYVADFNKIYPDAALGSYVYAWGKYFCESDGFLKFVLIPKGPCKLWMNGQMFFCTTFESERYDNEIQKIDMPVKKGWNDLILRFTKTRTGFGAEFGTWLGKLCYYFFKGLEHFTNNENPPSLFIEGFDYTKPLSSPLENPSPENIAALCVPLRSWTQEEKNKGVFGRIFPEAQKGGRALARTEIFLPSARKLGFSGTCSGNAMLYAAGALKIELKQEESFGFETQMKAGLTSITLISNNPGGLWDFSLEIKNDNRIVPLINPLFKTNEIPWIYAGVFSNTKNEDLLNFDREQLVGNEGEKTFWKLDKPDCWVRLYNENPLYGHWNYPLGVTLYGLLETGRLFEKSASKNAGCTGCKKNIGNAILSYARSHGAKSARTLDYALFDKGRFGGATAVHHLLTSIDSLDDCGSFGSFVLELAKDTDVPFFEKAASYVADHIINRQDRRSEGCFWRREMMHHFHNGTLWADDLYMSVPFLVRYSQFKKDESVLDLAAIQFEGFKKYLYMEDEKLMSHVFDFARNMKNGIPWGRGNGWTIFSLTELLMALPEDHPKREFLSGFFNSLSCGILACQDKCGMWHQVLNMPSSYIETSCTAMFICAFSRGVRYGWFGAEESSLPYREAAQKAWQALERYSIDKEGNIHGVCRGSEFAFNPKYYAQHLLPRLNDTHGIGIVLLAGVELLKMRQDL